MVPKNQCIHRHLTCITQGQFVNEYVGDLIDEAEVKKRLSNSHDADITNFYMLTLDKNRLVLIYEVTDSFHQPRQNKHFKLVV